MNNHTLKFNCNHCEYIITVTIMIVTGTPDRIPYIKQNHLQ